MIGSISGATPIVGGYVAYAGHFNMTALIIGLMMLVWQMPHFYAIAIYREKDYKNAKIPVLPVTKGYKIAGFWMALFSFLFVALNLALFWVGSVGKIYLIIMGAVSIGWFAYNLSGLFSHSVVSWAKKDFRYSLIVMLTMSVMLALR